MKIVKDFISIILQNKDLISLIKTFNIELAKYNGSIYTELSSSSSHQHSFQDLYANPNITEKINELEKNYEDAKALEIFNEIVRLFQITQDIMFNARNIPTTNNFENQEPKIINLSKELMAGLKPIIEIYKEFSKVNNEDYPETPSTKTVTLVEFKENSLEKIIQEAISPENHFKNYKLDDEQLLLIKVNIGEDLFEKISKKYSLSLDNFTLDDLRMIIIGVIVNCNKPWRENKFILSLLTVCGIDQNPTNNQAIPQLHAKIKMSDVVLKRISEETLRESFFDKNLKLFKKYFLSGWDFLLPIRFKANKAFKRDYKSSLAIASINDWKDKKDPKIQEFSSEEYLFNNLSTADFQDDTIIPILDKYGKECFYKVKNFIDAKSIHGFALIPVDPKDSLDIKVVFKNSKNLSEAILDTEHYAPYREFKQHKKYVLQKLNQIIEEFKQHSDMSAEQKELISLNIGGQGTGGTLASHLMHEIINQKTHFLIKDFISKDPEQQEKTLSSIFLNNITKQFLYENSLGNSKDKLSSKIVPKKYRMQIEKYAKKHLFNPQLQFAPNTSLLGINNLHLSTINSGGIPEKTRKNLIQCLYLLKDDTLSNHSTNISYNNLRVNNDMVKKTGATDFGTSLDPKLMHIKMLHITSAPPQFSKNLKKIGLSSLLLAGKTAVTTSLLCTIPHINLILNSVMNNFQSISENELLKNIITNMKEIWGKANNIHYGSYLNAKKCDYTLLDNNNPQEKIAIEEELKEKSDRSINNFLRKKIRNKIYKLIRKMQNLLGNYNYSLDDSLKQPPQNTPNIEPPALLSEIPVNRKIIVHSFDEQKNKSTFSENAENDYRAKNNPNQNQNK